MFGKMQLLCGQQHLSEPDWGGAHLGRYSRCHREPICPHVCDSSDKREMREPGVECWREEGGGQGNISAN